MLRTLAVLNYRTLRDFVIALAPLNVITGPNGSCKSSMLARVADPRRTPELLALREQIRSWRFYDHFRTDATAPSRQPQIGTHTTALSHDGADLAAALQTIQEIGDPSALEAAVSNAFPGGRGSRSSMPTAASRPRCTRAACCARCVRPNCPTARCATCCGSPRCCRLDHPRCWC